MGQPWGSELHTLAQLARRAGISEGRARGLLAKPSGLPRPDRTDAGGKPLWWGATIDAWCASTGRTVNDAALWLFQAEAATTAPAELRRGVVELAGNWGKWVKYFAIVWDTPHGHVIYLMPLGEWQHPDDVAHRAATLIEPRWWSTAIVVMPFPEDLGLFRTDLGLNNEPIAYLYRLTTAPPRKGTTPPAARPTTAGATDSAFGGIRRWWSRLVDIDQDRLEEETPPALRTPRAEWITSLTLAEIALPLGTRLPMWITGTISEEHVNRSLAYAGTFIVPDETTGWAAVQERLERAQQMRLVEQYPAAWAVLAVDARDRLDAIRRAQAGLPDSAPGWYLVARPAAPQIPVGLENQLTAAALATDPDQIAGELEALRAATADLEHDDPSADVSTEAINLLTLQLANLISEHRAALRGAGRLAGLAAARDRTTVPFSAPWGGPVIDEWIATLTPVDDITAALRRHRLVELLDNSSLSDADSIAAIYRDPAGRYIVAPRIEDDDERHFEAEWPVSLDAVAGWNDRTVIAADHPHHGTALLALTPTADGRMRVDPIPVTSEGRYQHAFAYGYNGGTPAKTYAALIRCALLPDDHHHLHLADLRAESQLWDTLTSTTGPLRLPWPQVQRWARADLGTYRSSATRPAQ